MLRTLILIVVFGLTSCYVPHHMNEYGNIRPDNPKWDVDPSEFQFESDSPLDTTVWYSGGRILVSPRGAMNDVEYCRVWGFLGDGSVLMNSCPCDSLNSQDELILVPAKERAMLVGQYRFINPSAITFTYFADSGGARYVSKEEVRISQDSLEVPVGNGFGKEVSQYWLVKTELPIIQ